MSIKLAIFDFAGTTVNDGDFARAALVLAFAEFGIELSDDEVQRVLHFSKPEAISILLTLRSIHDQDITHYIFWSYIENMLNYCAESPHLTLYPFAEETIFKLRKAGIRVGFVSGYPRPVVNTILRRVGWKLREKVDFCYTCDEIAVGIEYAGIIHQLMTEFNLEDPDEVARISSQVSDIEEGRTAGCKYVIAVNHDLKDISGLEKGKPTHIINDLSGILNIVTQNGQTLS